MDHGRSISSPPRLAASLFLSFFTAQAAFIVLAPALPQIGAEFGVSVAYAGQLRTAAAIAGLVAAVALALLGRRGAGRILRGGLVLLAAGAAVSAAAPTFALLAAGQLVLGAGAAAVLAGGLAAASEWPEPSRRKDVLAWTIVGQPAAWVVALPVVGLLADVNWRWAWLVVPVPALAALTTLPRRQDGRAAAGGTGRLWKDARVRSWAFGEVMAYAGWGGTLVYAGALISESYGIGAPAVALLLALAATLYFPGTFTARRRLDGDLSQLLALLALALALGTAIFGTVRVSPAVSTVVFALLVLLAGARGIAGGAFGLDAAPGDKVAIGSIRSGATQLGYLIGAAAGGAALEAGGYAAVGLTLAGLFSLAAAPHLATMWQRRAVAVVPCGSGS